MLILDAFDFLCMWIQLPINMIDYYVFDWSAKEK